MGEAVPQFTVPLYTPLYTPIYTQCSMISVKIISNIPILISAFKVKLKFLETDHNWHILKSDIPLSNRKCTTYLEIWKF